MHILVINDDGPPSHQSSPYVHPFIHYLQEAGHLISVVLPHQQRSWIGKSHLVGQLTKPTYFRPGNIHQDDGTTHEFPSAGSDEWVLVDGTPATCAQLGLYHFFQDRPPVDLVVSGPNYGRNSTSVFSLSSGTLGGALEAAVCQKKSIALSFAFFSRDHDPILIADACKHSIKVIEYLSQNWNAEVDLYSINVPIITHTDERRVMITNCLQNYWTSGSSFEEVEPDVKPPDPDEQEQQIRSGSGTEKIDAPFEANTDKLTIHKHRWFKWAPKFADIHKSVEESAPGNDGWAIRQGHTSVTPLKASFTQAPGVQLGELKLISEPSLTNLPISPTTLYTIIEADPYTSKFILQALEVSHSLKKHKHVPICSISDLPRHTDRLLQIRPYESIDFTHHLSHSSTSLANSYVIRKALIRKHHLWQTVSHWLVKNPGDISLLNHVPLTVTFELDYSEYLDEAIAECYELHESFAKKEPEWWILKPGMSDQGQGIRLFSSYEELLAIFQEWEDTTEEDSADEDEDEGKIGDEESSSLKSSTLTSTTSISKTFGNGMMTSQLRHFTAQRYISPLLLTPSFGLSLPEFNLHNHKFHIRSYILALGALQVYVYNDMLALFAREPYASPSASFSPDDFNPDVHLTNTCLDTSSSSPSLSNLVYPLSNLPFPQSVSSFKIQSQIHRTTSTLFLSAARTQTTHFQTLPNSFEIFGLDWLVDDQGTVWLLEVNAFPDFARTGEDLGERIVGGLWRSVIDIVLREGSMWAGRKEEEKGTSWRWGDGEGKVEGQKGNGKDSEEERGKMVKVLDVDLGRW